MTSNVNFNLPAMGPNAAGLGTKKATEQQPGFLEMLNGTMAQVESMHAEASTQVEALLQGNGQDLHGALIAVEKADIAFQLMMQVRNKIVNAYQEISRMQF
jgi:flagellar hook-basal body complex protein FliE